MRCSMDNRIEFEGKTVDDAIQKACTAFDVPREKLSIDIISEGTSGFLGLGSKKAKIQAELMVLDMHEEETMPTIEVKTNVPEVREKEPEVRPVPAPVTRTEKPAPKPSPVAPPVSKPAVNPEPKPVSVPAPTAAAESDEGMGQKAKELLEGLLERMSIPSPVTVTETDESIILNIQGDGDGLLIGKRGQNLDAIQHIINKVVNKASNGKKMIIVDTEAYRKRREESLVTLAERLGQKVKKTRKTVTVSNMNAHDRRIIHMTLQGDAALLTKSRGEGEYRKIIIMPAKREREGGQTRHKAAAE
jgi:spoIIIJ-associated protein